MVTRLLVWTLKDLRQSIEEMTSEEVKFDCVIFIEGKRGLGKSTLGYKILTGLKIEHPFIPKRDLVYTREDTLRHLSTKINGCIFSDEMINVAYKRDFYQEGQKDLLKGFDMYRDSRNVFVGCIPQFIDLDVKIQKVCKLRLSVIRRGYALVQLQLPSIYSQDPWDIRNNQKIESKWAMKGTRNPRYGQLTTVKGILRFGDLTPRAREEYDGIKLEKRNHVFNKYRDDDMMLDPEQIFMRNVLTEMKGGKVTPEVFHQLCMINGKSTETIRRKINTALKKDGDEKRWKDYCLSDKSKKRKDNLGFSVPEPIQMESQEAKESEPEKERKAAEPPPMEPINASNEEDMFGFQS